MYTYQTPDFTSLHNVAYDCKPGSLVRTANRTNRSVVQMESNKASVYTRHHGDKVVMKW